METSYNPFRSLELPFMDVPEGLRDKVMTDVATAKLLMELASLFSLNAGSIIERTVERREA